ncbi:FadR/GntR family transcriptional regulator [Marinobacterium weihaiense]|uniref:FCD domain-containing protein n=1 Tax=Marinobacterium weihaiense TaxID=2851016 RepID=A0ABS6MBU4_9GAMM|nr:FCD domain-containing protein [Marinobacterium weihaiense]MBV0933182.1 FCD domain-containing protein [Marinobacterium weihaiense]
MKLQHELERCLLDGDWLPGQTVPSERELMARYGASRGAVREALAGLRATGAIETRQGGRSRCCNLLAPHLQLPLAGREDDVEFQLQVLEARAALEGAAAWFAARRASDEELGRLDREYRRMCARASASGGQGEGTLEKAKADLQFHMLIAQSSHHLLVSAFSELFYNRYFNAIYSVLSRTLGRLGRYPDGIAQQHGAIHRALQARDAERAREQAQAHILYTRDLLRQCR